MIQIGDLVISYANIYLKDSSLFHIVLKVNKKLTLLILYVRILFFCILAKKPLIMKLTVSKLNSFLLFKLPSAFICGVRVKAIDEERCIVSVKHRWINQNPFNSMYFAVQAMAAELSTGALVMYQIQKCDRKISMLVANNKGNFTKKATGRITFVCNDGHLIEKAIKETIATGQGQTFWMKSVGTDEKGIQVSEMDFEWSVRAK